MNIIPIILTFDNNMSLPAAVCISSMMMSAKEDTFYDFFVLHTGEPPMIEGLDKIKAAYPNMRLQYRSVGNAFSGAFEIRGITEAAYYRLLAAELVTEYDKVIYTDVDVIYQMDLCSFYDLELCNNIVAAVHANGIANDKENCRYLQSIGLDPSSYVVSGFLLMDLAVMREKRLVHRFKELAKNNYKYQDQDIINIVCKDYIKLVNSGYSLGVAALKEIIDSNEMNSCKKGQIMLQSNIHYNGAKPWKGWCPSLDLWWEFYRKSPVYDPNVYFSFFYNRLEEYDQLPFIKRLKILFRYFTIGQKKPTY